MADRATRELALSKAVAIEEAAAGRGMGYDANRVVAVAKVFEKYLGAQDRRRDERGRFT